MARISTYSVDSTLTNDDLIVGIDSSNNNTVTYTLGDLSSFFNDASGADTNFYLSGTSVNSSTGVITLTVTGASNQAINLGTAAFSAVGDFATSSHTHTLGDVVGTNSITTTQLDVADNGTSGQYLASDGSGGFSWQTLSSSADNNYYLDGITKSGETLTFSVNGGANIDYTFGESAFLSIQEVITQVSAGIDIADIDTSLGALAALDSVGGGNINNNSISASKIISEAVTEEKLDVSNDPVSGYVLTSDGSDGFTWAANSASNYYVNAITKSSNTLTFEVAGGLASGSYPTYTFGNAAFKSTGTTSGDVATGDHSHDMSSITNAGTLATLDTVGSSEITTSAVTIDKLSPSAGSNGQFLTITGGNLAWTTISTTATDFLTLPSTPSSFSGTGGQYLKVNSGASAVEFAALAVGKTDITTTNSASAGKILGIDSNGDMEWTTKSTAGAGSVLPTNLNGISTDGTAGQLIQTDGDGTFSYATALFSVGFSDLKNEFKTVATAVTLSSSTTTATNDFSAAAVFPITLAGDATATTITYSNTTIGQTKILKVTGSGGTGTVTITGTKLGGTLDQTSSTVNYIQITAIGASEYIYTISQA